MCRKTIDAKAKRNDRYSSKQNWAREKHLNKQTVQNLPGLRNVHRILHAIACLNVFGQVLKSTLKNIF